MDPQPALVAKGVLLRARKSGICPQAERGVRAYQRGPWSGEVGRSPAQI